ncbi:hypothetical protein PIB30_027283 [Stylosanthes scabra]|uniref:Uncharacterized protein n=1 Tax=Stylosanthes scabra TaxID=79078 RepID=A0ABU6XAT5_9FABA|nr:hypothetical protein [Stylosanthes scabra]
MRTSSNPLRHCHQGSNGAQGYNLYFRYSCSRQPPMIQIWIIQTNYTKHLIRDGNFLRRGRPPSPSSLTTSPQFLSLNPKRPQIVHRRPKPPTPPVFPLYHHRPIIPLFVFLTSEHPKPRPPSCSSFFLGNRALHRHLERGEHCVQKQLQQPRSSTVPPPIISSSSCVLHFRPTRHPISIHR